MKSDSKKVWIAWGNTDLTEGKGAAYPKHICELEATAIRLGKKATSRDRIAPSVKTPRTG